MKSFIIACVVAVVLAVIGGAVLNSIQVPADKAFCTVGVRLGAYTSQGASRSAAGLVTRLTTH
jgi:hypothetical protein